MVFIADEPAEGVVYRRVLRGAQRIEICSTRGFRDDLDGNLKQDGTYDYTWGAENRLSAMHTGDLDNPQSNDKWLQFVYDYMGRRVGKTASTYTAGAWVEDSDLLFVYDGWNPVMVLNANASNATQYKLTWGPDLSGSIHGAGGIGGLLACVSTTGVDAGTYWYFYDANGNVQQVLDGNNLSITVAAYLYDPYGGVIEVGGTPGPYEFRWTSPFRFSTKWYDTETGLYYYGHRYYSPRLGRWISRDPIGERGGRNLYSAFGNRPPAAQDILGLLTWADCKCAIADAVTTAGCYATIASCVTCIIPGEGAGVGDAAECVLCLLGVPASILAIDETIDLCKSSPANIAAMNAMKKRLNDLKKKAEELMDKVNKPAPQPPMRVPPWG